MSSSFPQPLIELLRVALQDFECKPFPLGIERIKQIRYLRKLIAASTRDSCDLERLAMVRKE